MEPFDKFASSKKSSDKMEWSPELLLAFKTAKSQLQKINKTYLPHPDDQLILKPDAAQIKTSIGWVLYALRGGPENETLLPVMYCSARLPQYMSRWYPCELEAVGSVLAIDQAAHWTNESKHACCESGYTYEKGQTLEKPRTPILAGLREQKKHLVRPQFCQERPTHCSRRSQYIKNIM